MSDGKFIRIFTGMIIGGFILTIVLIILANFVGGGANNVSEVQKQLRNEKIAKHVEPIGKITVGAATPAATAAAPAPAAGGGAVSGKSTYESSCAACHTAGVAGAPKYGDGPAWKERLAQGKDVLYEHAIKGFQGKSGFMPPRGGADIGDDAVKAAVDHMVEAIK